MYKNKYKGKYLEYLVHRGEFIVFWSSEFLVNMLSVSKLKD